MSPELYERIKKMSIDPEKDEPVIEYPNCKDYKKNLSFEGKINSKELKKTKGHLAYTNLKKGNVITIEPGIYFIDTLIESSKANENQNQYIDFDLVEKYRVSL